jgi:hypothetical protein
MFKKLIKNKKAQNTAEYAILISLVVAGIIAMQTYAQRALQARVRDAGKYLSTETSGLGTSTQYEPYYLTTNYKVDRDEKEIQILDDRVLAGVQHRVNSSRTRGIGGYQESSYDTTILGLDTGL